MNQEGREPVKKGCEEKKIQANQAVRAASCKNQVKSEESSSKSEIVNDLIRQAREQHREIDIVKRKLILAEKDGFTDESADEIMAIAVRQDIENKV